MQIDIEKICVIINGYFNGTISIEERKNEISALFAGKSFSDTIIDIQSVSNKIRHRVLVILVLGYLLYDFNSKADIISVIKEKQLERVYFGGMRELLVGNSKKLQVKAFVNDNNFDNKLKYVNAFEPQYFQTDLLYLSCEILYDLSHESFENILTNEKTIYYLLSAYMGLINFKPSNHFLRALLKSKNDLQRNIALAFISKPLEDYIFAKNNNEIDVSIFDSLLNDFYLVLDETESDNVVSLLFNYILVNRKYPVSFILRITQEENINALCGQITKTKKIKTIQELKIISEGLFKYAEKIDDRIEYAICEQLKTLYNNGSFLYNYETDNKEHVDYIIKQLSEKSLHSLYTFFQECDDNLMIYELDKMTRFRIYNNDIKRHNCIIQILSVINQSLQTK